MSENAVKTPRWVLWILIVLMLPLVTFPALLSRTPEEHKTLLWFYPLYVLLTGYLAYRSYVSQREITYILIILLLFSHVAIWLLPYAN